MSILNQMKTKWIFETDILNIKVSGLTILETIKQNYSDFHRNNMKNHKERSIFSPFALFNSAVIGLHVGFFVCFSALGHSPS